MVAIRSTDVRLDQPYETCLLNKPSLYPINFKFGGVSFKVFKITWSGVNATLDAVPEDIPRTDDFPPNT